MRDAKDRVTFTFHLASPEIDLWEVVVDFGESPWPDLFPMGDPYVMYLSERDLCLLGDALIEKNFYTKEESD